MDKKNWARFVARQPADLTQLDPDIKSSWYKCIEFQLDPYRLKADQSANLKTRQLIKTHSDLITLFEKAVATIRDLMPQPAEPLFVLADASGRVISRIGGQNVLAAADDIGFTQGNLWTNQAVGTNAIGLALSTKKAASVARYQHFMSLSHQWSCFADVLLDDAHEIQAIVDLSFHADFDLRKGQHYLQYLLKAMALDWMAQKLQSQKVLLAAAEAADAQTVIIDDQRVIQRGFVRVTGHENLEKGQFVPTHLPNYLAKPLMDADRTVGWLLTPQSNQPADFQFTGVVAPDSPFQDFLKAVNKVAVSDAPVHLFGPTGSGKEVIAATIHKNSAFAQGPLVVVNCGALGDDLLQSELFGYVAGAFTGASPKGGIGKIQQADGGTLFLDEINSMSEKMQAALLRVLEDHLVTPVGGRSARKVSFRLITASNANLKTLVQKGQFREDLFYRLFVCNLQIPALKAHLADLKPLMDAFCQRKHWQVSNESLVLRVAKTYAWPGNVREFQNFLERLYVVDTGQALDETTLQALIAAGSLQSDTQAVEANTQEDELTWTPSTKEAADIGAALKANNGRKGETAIALGVSRSTLYRKMKQYDLRV